MPFSIIVRSVHIHINMPQSNNHRVIRLRQSEKLLVEQKHKASACISK